MINLRQSLRQVCQRLSEKTLLPTELCEIALKQAEQIKELNAFINITKNVAQVQALESNKRYHSGTVRGPLDGIPFAVKDNFCTYNIPTTCGSKMLQHFVPPYNATVVQKLLDNGAVLLGKCNMDEFAMGCGTVDSLFGPTKNIWKSHLDPRSELHNKQNYKGCNISDTNILCTDQEYTEDWHIAGGSSGGSAIAVASGTVFVALGSDTGGSTRNPAAYCGVVGLKPTYGLLSRHGLIPLVNSMDVPGILTRTVEDCAIVVNLLAGRDLKDSTTLNTAKDPVKLNEEMDIKQVCIGIPKEYHSPSLSAEVLSVWTTISDMLENGGAKVVQVSMPHTQSSVVCYSILNQCEVASNMARYDGVEFGLRSSNEISTEEMFAASRSEGFGEVVRSRILAGNYFLLDRNYSNYFLQALKVRRLIAEDFERVWASGVDILLTPTTLTEAPKFSEFINLENQQQCVTQDYCTQPANLAGCPAISIPIKLSKTGLPIGLQLIAKNFEENSLLNVANWVEKNVNFPQINKIE